MLAVWRGEQDHHYAEQAVIASLSAYLMLLENIALPEATTRASDMWAGRNTQRLPFEAR